MTRSPNGVLQDPLAIAALVAMVIVGTITAIDLVNDGRLEPGLLELFVSVFGPLTPALIVRSRESRNGK
jgi:hypothetical protein